MAKVKLHISMSLGGFVAGPNQTPLGLERERVVESPTGVTHIKYRVLR